jgi:molybdopterin adenylyltransferase
MRAAIITVSTSRSESGGTDESGERLARLVERLELDLAGRELIPDDVKQIEARLRHWADVERCELILTTGGTGVSPNDLTPEATRMVIEREIPGISHAMLEASRAHTPYWMLSRGIAGTRGGSIIINFPGSPRSIEQIGETLIEALPHAIRLLTGAPSPH